MQWLKTIMNLVSSNAKLNEQTKRPGYSKQDLYELKYGWSPENLLIVDDITILKTYVQKVVGRMSQFNTKEDLFLDISIDKANNPELMINQMLHQLVLFKGWNPYKTSNTFKDVFSSFMKTCVITRKGEWQELEHSKYGRGPYFIHNNSFFTIDSRRLKYLNDLFNK